MSPKIIHYIWLGGNPLPDLVQKCIKSWEKYCPDYEIKLWNESNLDLNKYQFAKDAYDNKKWAFAADVFRYDVINEFGGIYLDVDVELFKPLDDFLGYNFFTGFEDSEVVAPGLIMGGVADNAICQDILEHYTNIKFDIDKLNEITVCKILTKYLVEHYDLKQNNQTQILQNEVGIFTTEYFCPKNYKTGKINITENTYSIHHYLASWVKKPSLFKRVKNTIKSIIKKIIGEKRVKQIKAKMRGKND